MYWLVVSMHMQLRIDVHTYSRRKQYWWEQIACSDGQAHSLGEVSVLWHAFCIVLAKEIYKNWSIELASGMGRVQLVSIIV